MDDYRKFGEKSSDKQTVFIVEYQDDKNKEYGVLGVYNNLENASDRAIQLLKDYARDEYHEGRQVIVSQRDIED